ncbi:MAG TPA: ribonuclease R, partial [Agriterribacter sp.]|nr:ribonuclease R [Agriterribacter sp.]
MKYKNSRKVKAKPPTHTYEGTLDVTRSGMGYVIVENQEKDIFVRPQDFNHALHGDRVKVNVTRHNPKTGKMEGEVLEVVKRRQTEFTGRLEMSTDFAFFIPDKAKGTPDMYIPAGKLNGAQDANRVVVRITDWDRKAKSPNAEVVSILNPADENDMAMKQILV